MSKIYTVTNSRGQVITKGRCRKLAWRSPRWVLYHAKYMSTSNDVHTIDLETNTITKMALPAFVAKHQNPEAHKAEILKRFNINADLESLESMVKAGMIIPTIEYQIRQFLKEKGINC